MQNAESNKKNIKRNPTKQMNPVHIKYTKKQ